MKKLSQHQQFNIEVAATWSRILKEELSKEYIEDLKKHSQEFKEIIDRLREKQKMTHQNTVDINKSDA